MFSPNAVVEGRCVDESIKSTVTNSWPRSLDNRHFAASADNSFGERPNCARFLIRKEKKEVILQIDLLTGWLLRPSVRLRYLVL